ncbi:hypothetical protein BJ170DRAFT_577963, partial [Xylariales sp. AK1849]
MTSQGNSAALEANYNPAVVTLECVQRIMWQLDEILRQLAEAPLDLPTKEISCVSPQEVAQLREWSNAISSSDQRTVHDTIVYWANKQPTAEAIDAWDGLLSFNELDQFSSRLAIYLRRSYKISRGSLVALSIERSALALVCMIAVMKAGAVFIPLDPANPRPRNEEIVKTTGAKRVLVAVPGFCPDMATIVSWKFLDTLPCTRGQWLPRVQPDSLAYIMFTPGSPGRPKGVMVEHRSLAYNMAKHGGEIYQQNTSTRVLQSASLASNASMSEHLAPLFNGGCVCVPSSETRLDGLAEYINDHRVNWSILTPSSCKFLDPQDTPSLKTVVLGGEALTNDCIEKFAEKTRLINGYGPSEGRVVATCTILDHSSQQRSSIGPGLICKTWVVDAEDYHQLVPSGAIGELALQGPPIARGYLNNEEQTNAALVSTPWWGCEDERPGFSHIHKTGDLVRCANDGSLLYMGRKDTQVKVRAQRLELSEVE